MHVWPQRPAPSAARIDWLLYHRRAYVTNLALAMPFLVALWVFMPGIFVVLGLAFWLPSALIGLPVCELQIRRERERGRERQRLDA